MSGDSLRFLYLFSVGFFILFVFVLQTRRYLLKRILDRRAAAARELEELLAGFASGSLSVEEFVSFISSRAAIRMTSSVFQKVLCDAAARLGDSVDFASVSEKDMAGLLERTGVRCFLRLMMRSRWAWKRAYAVNLAIKLGCPFFLDEVLPLVHDRWEFVRLLAVEYMMMFQEEEELCGSMADYVSVLSGVEHWLLRNYEKILARRAGAAERLVELYESGSLAEKDAVCAVRLLQGCSLALVELFFKRVIRQPGTVEDVRLVAARYLLQADPLYLVEGKFYEDISPRLRAVAFLALGKVEYRKEFLEVLLSHAGDRFGQIRKSISAALVSLVRQDREALRDLVDEFISCSAGDRERLIAGTFGIINLTDNYVRMLFHKDTAARAEEFLAKMARNGEVGDILDYLARARNTGLRKRVAELLMEHCDPYVLGDSGDLLARLPDPERGELLSYARMRDVEGAAGERRLLMRMALAGVVIVAIAAPVLWCAWLHRDLLAAGQWKQLGAAFVIAFNRLIVYYVLSINSFYLVLAILSMAGTAVYLRRRSVVTRGDCFWRNLVPPVSVIAPSYNEAAGITESVNSLLNIKYPEFEVIVVNDGSRDETMARLIDYYGLEKVPAVYEEAIPTSPVRGVYASRRYKNLFVIDKSNGGKADALNAGINFARFPVFCAIDADTLISGDSLLRTALPFLFDHSRSVASGGNIRLANGCLVDRGVVEEVRLPSKLIERFQMIEYLRAFLSGRTGWALFNGLLIISGAFGVFKKNVAMAIGGYSTSRSRHFDTVGEDMELVVDFHRYLRKERIPYRIAFCPDARGWTEVPDNVKVLKRQRNRWQRGLIEVLLKNALLLFNPAYGSVGLVSAPYFFVFEFLGPWIECTGYLFIVVAALVGILNIDIFLLLLVLSIIYGGFISLISLLLEEWERPRFSNREFLSMVLVSVIENFGFRQLMAFWRAGAYLTFVFKKGSWGAMPRRGFSGRALPGVHFPESRARESVF